MNVAEYERMHVAEERQWWYAGMRAISFRLLDAATDSTATAPLPLRFLDAGCGTGLNLSHLAERGRAVGVDLAEEAVRFARSRGVNVVRGNVLRLPFRDGSVDGVSSFDVLYHAWVTDDGAAVRELARVLRPGGRLLVRVPALKLLWGAHDEAVLSRHRYHRRELRALLEGTGLEVDRISYCNSILFPLLLARRTLDRWLDRHGSDVEFLPAPLEWAFKKALLAEAALIGRGFSLPVGASLVALARKK
jgi:SAM-dependent methyltransferase